MSYPPPPRSPPRGRSPPPPPYRRYSRSPSPRRERTPSPPRFRRPSPKVYGVDTHKRPTSCLFVGNLPYHYRERDVADHFESVGRLRNVVVGINKRTGQSKGYAFVEYEDRRDAEDAFHKFQGFNVGGRRLRIDYDQGMDKKRSEPGSRGPPQNFRRSPPRRFSRSPPRRYSRSPPPRRFSRSPPRYPPPMRGGYGGRSPPGGRRSFTPSPPRRSSRTPSPRGRSPGRPPMDRKRSLSPGNGNIEADKRLKQEM